jgi:hypothetical protein
MAKRAALKSSGLHPQASNCFEGTKRNRDLAAVYRGFEVVNLHYKMLIAEG